MLQEKKTEGFKEHHDSHDPDKIEEALELCRDIRRFYQTGRPEDSEEARERHRRRLEHAEDTQKLETRIRAQVMAELAAARQESAAAGEKNAAARQESAAVRHESAAAREVREKTASVSKITKEPETASELGLEKDPKMEIFEGQEPEGEEPSPAKQGGIVRGIGRIVKFLLTALLCFCIAYGAAGLFVDHIAQMVIVEGISMEDTLENGDLLLASKLSYRLHDPERFDIVIFPYLTQEHYVKRILGLPGETVQIREHQIYINGEVLLEGFGREKIEDGGIAGEEIVLGEDEYFVMGDNRNHSVDSRDPAVGVVRGQSFEGKVVLRLYPFSSIQSFY